MKNMFAILKVLVIFVVVAALALLAGCATKEMKSTPFYEGTQVEYKGDAKDRVNLWPVAYWRNPAGSVAWPLLSFSDDLFALRPVYSQYKQDGVKGEYDEFNLLWPIAQADTMHRDYRVFPVFWGESHVSNQNYQAVFPLYWNGPHYNSLYPLWIYRGYDDHWSFHTIGGLAGGRRDEEGYRASWCFPLWYENNKGVLATTLFGYTPESRWCFPLWYRDKDTFISIPYSRGRYSYGEKDTWWASPGLLSWGKTRHWTARTSYEGYLLLGMWGWDWTEYADSDHSRKGDYRHQWWAWPLGGRTTRLDSRKKKGEKTWKQETESSSWGLSGLVGWRSRDDQIRESRFWPLYDWERDDHLWTPLGGWSDTEIWATPLVGIYREKKSSHGGWVFPFWHHSKSKDYDENLAKLADSPTLPECIKVSVETRTNKQGKVEHRWYASGPDGHDTTTWLLLSDNDRSFVARGWNGFEAATNDCRVAFLHKLGNKLLLNYESGREVRYNLKTREKMSDKTEADGSFLVWLYQYESSREPMKKEHYLRHRVLWKLWDWEEDEDGVALDIFPGFTYDRQKDGSTKTSFLWRFFRYERDPKDGTSVDLLFLPVWRP